MMVVPGTAATGRGPGGSISLSCSAQRPRDTRSTPVMEPRQGRWPTLPLPREQQVECAGGCAAQTGYRHPPARTLYVTLYPYCAPRAMVVTAMCDTKLMEHSASPRKPSVLMVSRSSNEDSLLVVWRWHRMGRSSFCRVSQQGCNYRPSWARPESPGGHKDET